MSEPRLFTFDCTLTGYFPDNSPLEGGFLDMRDKPLCTLEEHVAGHQPYCSVAMDPDVLPYGTMLAIPSFNRRYGRQLVFRVTDTGGAFKGKGFRRADICTSDKTASESDFLNGEHLVVALIGAKG